MSLNAGAEQGVDRSSAPAGNGKGDDGDEPRTRRRGEELETALLDAAWIEIRDHGYDALTYEAVAERAQTSRAVVYRRWPTKAALATAVLDRGFGYERPIPPDTGTLRGDLMALLHVANDRNLVILMVMATRLGGYFAETGTGPADVRDRVLAGRSSRLDAIYERAIARGEVDPARLTPRARTLPFDLFRGEMLMTLKPVSEATIESIIDEIVLPLVARRLG